MPYLLTHDAFRKTVVLRYISPGPIDMCMRAEARLWVDELMAMIEAPRIIRAELRVIDLYLGLATGVYQRRVDVSRGDVVIVVRMKDLVDRRPKIALVEQYDVVGSGFERLVGLVEVVRAGRPANKRPCKGGNNEKPQLKPVGTYFLDLGRCRLVRFSWEQIPGFRRMRADRGRSFSHSQNP